jgi:hypothetical protein
MIDIRLQFVDQAGSHGVLYGTGVRPSVNGHLNLPAGGHGISPRTATC